MVKTSANIVVFIKVLNTLATVPTHFLTHVGKWLSFILLAPRFCTPFLSQPHLFKHTTYLLGEALGGQYTTPVKIVPTFVRYLTHTASIPSCSKSGLLKLLINIWYIQENSPMPSASLVLSIQGIFLHCYLTISHALGQPCLRHSKYEW